MKQPISDERLRNEVIKEIQSDPEISTGHLSVDADAGAVTLRGHVLTYHEKHEAVRAAERVPDVRAVADQIEVRSSSPHERGDDEIAADVAKRRGRVPDSPGSVGVQVRDGRVILHGQVTSAAERDAIDKAAHELAGVRAVDNLIEVATPTEQTLDDLECRVQEAVKEATIDSEDAGSIEVTMDGTTAHLHGHLRSFEALQKAVRAAEGTQGVTSVECEIAVTIQNEDNSG